MLEKCLLIGLSHIDTGFDMDHDSVVAVHSHARAISLHPDYEFAVAERRHDGTFLGFVMCLHDLSDDDMVLIITSILKVWINFDSLRNRNYDVAVAVGR